ncbi:acyltransferase family protein [Maridesulfovibrio sp. FT414]|uniref:acyltransferase family protein n=1 Tax=Maridesulfovibrio sp. FT414 TaxID=2979469 RepID=UPI003D808FD4
MNSRMYFLDNLRAAAIFAVVLLHVSLCYMKFAPSWWFVVDPGQSIFFTYVVVLADVPVMPIMFFLSGYFALASLQKHGLSGFWAAKFKRIIIPWVLGVLFLAPPAMYMILLSRGKAPGYLEFWGGQFWTTMYSQSVFWFLGLLTVFYLILSACYTLFPDLRSPAGRSRIPSPLLPVLFVASCTSLFLFMNRFYPVDTWVTDYYVLAFQPLRVAVYLLYFWLGILAWKRNWFARQGYNPRLLPWLGAIIISAMFYLHFKMQMVPRGGEILMQLGNALGFNVLGFSCLMGGVAAFKKYLNSGQPVWRSLAASSYGIYFFHSLTVYYGAYFLLEFNVSPFIKAPLLFACSILICWVLTLALKKNRVGAGIL